MFYQINSNGVVFGHGHTLSSSVAMLYQLWIGEIHTAIKNPTNLQTHFQFICIKHSNLFAAKISIIASLHG